MAEKAPKQLKRRSGPNPKRAEVETAKWLCGIPGSKLPRTTVKKKRAKPRKGRVLDAEYRAWILTQPCIVTGRLDVTGHHVRFCGSPKSDKRMLPLIAPLHMLGSEYPKELWGQIVNTMGGLFSAGPCVERGKRVFEAYWGVNIEAEIVKLNAKYAEETGK